MVSETEIIIRIALSALLGASVGFEREKRGQTAGLRTNTILSIGAALAMTLSINLAYPNYDPTRLAAQVISGIGFLGAGAILRSGMNVKGLTTAATLWTMATVGLACGAGYYIPAIATTLLILLVLTVLDILEVRFIRSLMTLTVTVEAQNQPDIQENIKSALAEKDISIKTMTYSLDRASNLITFVFIIRANENEHLAHQLLQNLHQVSAVTKTHVAAS